MRNHFSRLSAAVGGLFLWAFPVIAQTTTTANNTASGLPGVDITIGSLYAIFQNLACYASKFILILMVIMIIWYGFQMMLAQSNATKFSDARKSLGYAVVGMIVILGAYTIIATVGNAVQGVGAQNLSTRSSDYINYTPLGSCSS